MSQLVIRFHRDRNICGNLSLLDVRGRRICGPFTVAGRSSDAYAAAHGNHTRNPLFRFGDTPTGAYRVRETLKSGKRTPFETGQFGPNGVVILDAISGDAALAEANGRFHLLIVGGKSAAGALRSTAGSLRLSDEDQNTLIAALQKLPGTSCVIEENESIKSRGRVYDDPHCEHDDPHELSSSKERAGKRSINKELLLGSAAGAMVLEVVFVTLSGTPAHASQMPVVQNLQHAQDHVAFLPPKASSPVGYVRLAYEVPPNISSSTASGPSTSAPAVSSGTSTSPAAGSAPPGSAMQQLQNVQQNTQSAPNAATPEDMKRQSEFNTTNNVVQAPPNSGGGSALIEQQRQINAIRAQNPPPNATQEQLNQWQQNQQQQIQNILHPPPPKKSTVPPTSSGQGSHQ